MEFWRPCAWFWNVYNLFEVEAVDRAPKSQAELEAKLDRIAEVLNGETPHRIALAEVQSLGLLERLHARLSGTFDVLWEDGPPEGATVGTGLAVLAGPTIFDEMSKVDVYRPTRWMRPRALNVELSVASALGRGGRFLLSCNHRKSRMRYGNVDPASDQNDTAEWLGDQLAGYDRTDCAVVVGDFNAEPWEPAFGDFKLRSRRTFSGALWSGSTPAYLYNTAWRFASEPSYWDQVQGGRRVTERRACRCARTQVGGQDSSGWGAPVLALCRHGESGEAGQFESSRQGLSSCCGACCVPQRHELRRSVSMLRAF